MNGWLNMWKGGGWEKVAALLCIQDRVVLEAVILGLDGKKGLSVGDLGQL